MAPACNRSSGEGRDSGRGRFAGIPIGGNGRGDGAEEDGRILGGCGGCTYVKVEKNREKMILF